MQIASRFAVAVHLLSLLGMDTKQGRSSEWIAGSIGVNSVIVRNVTAMLRRAGLVLTQQGVTGARLALPLADISLLHVYRAVNAVKPDALFAFHAMPDPACTVGANIQAALEGTLRDAQRAMEARLAARTMADIVEEIRTRSSMTVFTNGEKQ